MFCGIGGLSYGLGRAGIKVLAGLDNDGGCESVYVKNNKAKFIKADIKEYNFEEMKALYSKGSTRVLVGCAPCQPFSSLYNAKKRQNDDRCSLMRHFAEAVKVLNPDVISMENVRGAANTDIFKAFVEEIERLGYETNYKVVACADYGVPQSRKRLVFLASKFGKPPIPASTTHKKREFMTVEKSIGSLSKIKAGGVCAKDPLHRARKLSDINLARIRQSKPGGSWHDWNEELLPNCYKKASGKSYTAVYGRMRWNALPPTITTEFMQYGSGRFGHPEQDRALSIREGALLQTFPKKYNFGKQATLAALAKHIGNAVPPKLGFAIGKTIREHIRNAA